MMATFDASVESVQTLGRQGRRPPDAGADRTRACRRGCACRCRRRTRPPGLGAGATIQLARLADAAGADGGARRHDFARAAWFQGIGGAGRALEPVDGRRAGARRRARCARATGSAGISATRLPGAERRHRRRARHRRPGGSPRGRRRGDAPLGPRPSALGQRPPSHRGGRRGDAADAEAARAEPRLALRFRLCWSPPGVGALAGIAYTLLTGAEVPTVRACIAALLVLAGIALGREALSLAPGRGRRAGRAPALARSAGRRELPDELRRDHRDRRAAHAAGPALALAPRRRAGRAAGARAARRWSSPASRSRSR